jgi:hypothetical protein
VLPEVVHAGHGVKELALHQNGGIKVADHPVQPDKRGVADGFDDVVVDPCHLVIPEMGWPS